MNQKTVKLLEQYNLLMDVKSNHNIWDCSVSDFSYLVKSVQEEMENRIIDQLCSDFNLIGLKK